MPPIYKGPKPTNGKEVREIATRLLRRTGDGNPTHDPLKMFSSWLATEPSDYRTCKEWMLKVHPDINASTLQSWGGRGFWNLCRDIVRSEAIGKAMDKTPDLLANKFERQLRIVAKLEDAVEKTAEKIMRIPEPPIEPGKDATKEQIVQYGAELRDYRRDLRAYDASAVKALTEAIHKLAETNILLRNDGVQKHEVTTKNLHAVIVDKIKERDARFGIAD